MTSLTCAATRRRLQAFHDHELSMDSQIAVARHLGRCDRCSDELAELCEVRQALHALTSGRLRLSHEEAAAFNAGVVNRLAAEEAASLSARVRDLFDDLHVVYAGLGAAVATMVCLVIMLAMMRFATSERSDSLAAIVRVLATPLECESGNDLADGSGCRARWAERFERANETAELDAVFTLEAVVSRRGGLANMAGLRFAQGRGVRGAEGELKLIEGLLDGVARARLDPAQAGPLPQSLNMLWLVEHTTVRASKPPAPALDAPLPKKRAASLSDLVRRVRA
jgi:hypothetical protein